MEKIVIIGGGLSGLAASYFLRNKADITLLEASSRLGGWIETVEKEGFLFECGPRGFRPKGKGAFTYDLALRLGLTPMGSNKKAGHRFLAHKQSIEPITLTYLLKKGLLSAFLKDLRCKPSIHADESLESFFSRHFGSYFAKTFINPLARGIFAGDYSRLSAQSCFPNLWDIDQNVGSLIRGRSNKRSKLPPLMSFKNGMEELVKALTAPVQKVVLNTPAIGIKKGCVQTPYGEIEADKVILALPAKNWAHWFGLSDPNPYASLTTVSLGWQEPVLKKQGYGFLVPGDGALMGMTFDSCIFPFQKGTCRVCAMITKEKDPAKILSIAQDAASIYLGIHKPADTYHLKSAYGCIAQYQVGHKSRIDQLLQKLPSWILPMGSSLFGVAVNDCLYTTHERLIEKKWI